MGQVMPLDDYMPIEPVKTKQYTMMVLVKVTVPADADADESGLWVKFPESGVEVMSGGEPLAGATIDDYETESVTLYGDEENDGEADEIDAEYKFL